MPGPAPSIAYVARVLPLLSETFVVREAAALRQLGADVKLLSIYPPQLSFIHPEWPDAGQQAITLLRPLDPVFWLSHITFALFHTRRYFSCIQSCIAGSRKSLRSRFRCLAHFLPVPYTAVHIRKMGITHLHAHFATIAASIAMMAARLTDIPFSFAAHAYDIFLNNTLLAEKIAEARFVTTCCDFLVQYLREHAPAAGGAHIEVVRCGIDPVRIRMLQPRRVGLPPVILAVGRLVETKGFHTLIQACRLLKKRGVGAECRIVGAGPDESRLEAMVAAEGVSDRVFFLGELPPAEVLQCYGKADVFAMPSCVRNNDRDGIPTVLMEAMATGIPVVSTRVSGIPELVRNEETGLSVEPDDPEALADALERLIKDRELADRLAQEGRRIVEEEFNIYRSAEHLLGLICKESPGRA